MLGPAQLGEEPLNLLRVEWLIDFDGSVAGDAGSDAAATGFGIFGLAVTVGDGQNLFQHLLELTAFEAYGSGFDCQRAWAEGLCLKAVAFQLLGDLGEGDHLSGKEIDE